MFPATQKIDVCIEASEGGPFRSLLSNGETAEAVLSRVGLVKPHEVICSVRDRPYSRGGAECYFAPIQVKVLSEGSVITRTAIAKCWLRAGKGKMMEMRRAHLQEHGMPVLPQYGHVLSPSNAEDISETFQHHARPVAFENNERVKDAGESISELTPQDAKVIGKMAAILDENRYSPTRILSDVLISDEGPVFNDFGYDLGDPGPETRLYFGCPEPIQYFKGVQAIARELKSGRREDLLEAAITSYAEHRKMDLDVIRRELR